MINVRSKWFLYSILGIFFVCIVDLGRKYLLDKNHIKVDEMIIYLAIFAGILGFMHFMFDSKCRNPNKISGKSLFYVFLLAVSVYAFNISFTRSIYYASDVTGSYNDFTFCYFYLFVFKFIF